MSLSKSGIDTPIEKLPGKSLEAPVKSYPGSESIGRGDHGQPELGKFKTGTIEGPQDCGHK